MLHSYSQEYPWTKLQHEGFLRKLGAAVPDTIAPSVEYLDTKRVAYTAAYADFFAAHLAGKYAGFEPKLIYVTDDNALLFALSHLTRIFPKAPIFFSGINDYGVRKRIDPDRVTGVFEQKEIGPNLDLMRHLVPGTREVLVVGDESETFNAIRHEVSAELAHQPDIQAKFLSSGRIERLVAALQGRTEKFVFLTTLGAVTDAAGNTLTLPETISAIVRAGQFIIISMEDAYLFPGVLGGYVTSGHRQGQAAADMSARYLGGTAVSAIAPVLASPNEYIVDGGELNKLGLTFPQELAGRTSIRNPQPTFYERHFAAIVKSLYAFALLFAASTAAFIFALLRKNRQIAHTSKELTEQTKWMRESEEKLRGLYELSPIGISLNQLDGRFVECNKAFQHICGYNSAELTQLDYWALTPEKYAADEARQLESLERDGLYGPYEKEFIRKDGQLVPVRLNGMLLNGKDGKNYIWSLIENITVGKRADAARASLETQLRESQKMEALGTLAGGVAHDFNNVLAAISGNVALAREDAGPGHPALVSLEEIEKASRRAKDIVQQILAFGRRQALERKAMSLSLVVVESARLIRATLPSQVSLTVECRTDAPAVLADATQIKQILLNLCGNALHAVEHREVPGSIEIRLEAFAQDEAHGDLRPGRYARLSVRDNGSGMDEPTRSRIFEPFFTTKPTGKGTGLGLSVVHGIVKAHEATLEVVSAPGDGSEFRIYFPAVDAPLASEIHPPPDAASERGEGRHVLYVDDEEAIIFLMKRLLERKGYRVSGFTDPGDALAAMRANPGQFDLVVTDYNMPGMSGLEVARAIRSIRADLPIVMASGYITEELRRMAPDAGVDELVFKPNTVDELCDAIARFAKTHEGGEGLP